MFAATKEFFRVFYFVINVVLSDFGGQLDLFDLDDFLLFFRLFELFFLLIAKFAVVHDLANGRLCIGRYQNQIHTLSLGNLQRLSL